LWRLLFLFLFVIHLNGGGDDKVLYRVDDLFALGLVVVGFADKVGGGADVLEHVAVVPELVAVHKEVAHVGGALKGVDTVAAGFFAGIVTAGIKDLTVNRCFFDHTDRGLRIKTCRGRGEDARIDGVTFENIRMDNVLTPLVINMYYFCDPDGKSEYVQTREALPVDERTPYLGSFTFRNMECINCESAAGFFYGLPEQPIGSVKIENVSVTCKEDAQPFMPAMLCGIEPHCKAGLRFFCVKKVELDNVTLNGCVGEPIVCEKVGSFSEV